MKVGVLGGSFNPVHYGHLEICEKALKYFDEVWLMPCYNHQFDKDNISFDDRYRMIELILKDFNKRIKVSDFEKRKNKESATIDTMRKLKKEYPNYNFYWIIGSDILDEIHNWKDYKDLKKEVNFLVFEREEYEPRDLPKNFELKKEDISFKISSSGVRKKIREGKELDKYMPKEVADYIEDNKLYI